MASRRLKPLKKAKESLSKVNTKKIIIFIGLGIVVIGLVVVAYIYRDDILMILPGYYQNSQYNSLTSKKNDLIEDNTEILLDNDELNEQSSTLGSTIKDYEQKISNNESVLENLDEVTKNINKVLEYDNDFLEMRLPYVIEKYVRLSKDVDEVRKEMFGVSSEIVESRIDIDTFNRKRAGFDKCLDDIDWNSSDAKISSSIKSCNKKLDEMETMVDEMEKKYDIKLEKMREYVSLLKTQWDASAKYYSALSKRDYTTANKYDDTFTSAKRKITDLGMDAFNEFNELVVDPLVEEFEKLSKEETEKEQEADDWYQNNVKR